MKQTSSLHSDLVSVDAKLDKNVAIWEGTKVREGASIGHGTSIGQYCYVGPHVSIGRNCKIQNHALIYEPTVVEDGVFIGPRVVITNDLNPRAVTVDGNTKTENDWVKVAAHIKTGASLGAGSILVGAITIGEWSMIAAGSVVTKDVKPFALVAGVPSRQIGWVSEAGFKLVSDSSGDLVCPKNNSHYRVSAAGYLTRVET